MNAAQFTSLIKDFDSLSNKEPKVFEELIKKFPYFQLPYLYYAKLLQQKDTSAFTSFLPKCAIRTFDRKLLHEWVERPLVKTTDDAKKKKIVKAQSKATEQKTTPAPAKEKVTLAPVQPKQLKPKAPVKNTNALSDSAKPSTSNPSRKLIFLDWIRRFEKRPPDSNKIEEKRPPSKDSVIDTFLDSNQKIQPQRKERNEVDLSKESLATDQELMTETLAKVLVQQKKYVKAIKAYSILSLKYPEKNSFFAARIENIKQLQKSKDKS